MSTVQLKPQKTQLTAWSAALAALLVVTFLFPWLSLPLALATPLLACPLAACRRWILPCVAAVFPALLGLHRQMPTAYALSLAAPCLLMLAVTCLSAEKRSGARGLVWYMGAGTLGLALVVVGASLSFGTPLTQTLARRLTHAVETSPQGGQILQGLVQAGLLSTGGKTLISARELLLSLELLAHNLLEVLLPTLFVQGAVISGLFTGLRLRKADGVVVVVKSRQNGERKAAVLVQPGFRLLMIPQGLGIVLLVMGLCGLPLCEADESLLRMLGQLFTAAFSTAFTLQGAAVLVCAATARQPDRAAWAGVLAGVLYVLFPMALTVMGAGDQIFHYRARLLQSMQKKQ